MAKPVEAHDLVVHAITPIECENCPTVIQPGQRVEIMSPTDIRLVCTTCFDKRPRG